MTHLRHLLEHRPAEELGIEEIVVWAGGATLGALPDGPWIRKKRHAFLDRALPYRVTWQQLILPAELQKEGCSTLLSPGGTAPLLGSFARVTMSQNMLPFEPAEAARYGISPMRVKLLLLKRAQSASFRRSAGVIFLSEYARTSICAWLGNRSLLTTVIPHGIGDEFRHVPRPQRAIGEYSTDRPFRLLYVSIIDAYKHQVEVVRAVDVLRRKGVPVELRLVGPGYGPSLRILRRALDEIDPARTFVHEDGAVSYSQLAAHYHAADMFVYASSCENLPIILLEAMAAGLPIASSSRGPMREVLGDAGGYFDPEDVPGIAAVLERYIESPALREASARRATERAGSYRWEDAAAKTYAFLAQVAGRGRDSVGILPGHAS